MNVILTLIFFIFAHSFFLDAFQPVFLPAVPSDFSLAVVLTIHRSTLLTQASVIRRRSVCRAYQQALELLR